MKTSRKRDLGIAFTSEIGRFIEPTFCIFGINTKSFLVITNTMKCGDQALHTFYRVNLEPQERRLEQISAFACVNPYEFKQHL